MNKILTIVGNNGHLGAAKELSEISKEVSERSVSCVAQGVILVVGALLQTAKAVVKIPLTFLVTILGIKDGKLESFSLKGI